MNTKLNIFNLILNRREKNGVRLEESESFRRESGRDRIPPVFCQNLDYRSHLSISNRFDPLLLGLKNSKNLIPNNLEWLYSKVVHHRIPRVEFLIDQYEETFDYEDDSLYNDFNGELSEVISSSDYETIEVYYQFKNLSANIFEKLMERIIPGGKLILLNSEENREKLLSFNLVKIQQEFQLVTLKLKDGSPLYRAILPSESAIVARCEGYVTLEEQYPQGSVLVLEKKEGKTQNMAELLAGEFLENTIDDNEIVRAEETDETEDEDETEGKNNLGTKKRKPKTPPETKTSITRKNRKLLEEIVPSPSLQKSRSRAKKVDEEVEEEKMNIVYDLTVSQECSVNFIPFVRSLRDQINGDFEILVRNIKTNEVSRLKTTEGLE